MKYRIGLIHGDGIGPEIVKEAKKVLDAVCRKYGHILTELQQIATVYGFLNKGVLAEEITAHALYEKCSDCIDIKVSDVEKYSALLEKEFPNENYKVLPENDIRIYKPQTRAEVYSRLASENGVYITGMKVIQTSLEDYYMELKKRGG